MPALCTIVFAGFCFSGIPVAFDGVDAGMGYRVHVETSAYVAESRGADAVPPLDWRGSHRACVAGQCLNYWKHCEPNGHRLRCEYTFSDGSGDGVDHRSITVSVADEKALAIAESRIGVQLGDGKETVTLMLAAMTQHSETPPPCPAGQPPTICKAAR
jgi:hypothetical protein